MAGKFEPKVPVQLNPPKDDPISVEELSKATGKLKSEPRFQIHVPLHEPTTSSLTVLVHVRRMLLASFTKA